MVKSDDSCFFSFTQSSLSIKKQTEKYENNDKMKKAQSPIIFVQESFFFLKSSLFILFHEFIIISYIFFLFLNQTQKVKQHFNPDCHTHIPSQLTRTKDNDSFFFSFTVLLQGHDPNLHLWNAGSFSDPHHMNVGGYPFGRS